MAPDHGFRVKPAVSASLCSPTCGCTTTTSISPSTAAKKSTDAIRAAGKPRSRKARLDQRAAAASSAPPLVASEAGQQCAAGGRQRPVPARPPHRAALEQGIDDQTGARDRQRRTGEVQTRSPDGAVLAQQAAGQQDRGAGGTLTRNTPRHVEPKRRARQRSAGRHPTGNAVDGRRPAHLDQVAMNPDRAPRTRLRGRGHRPHQPDRRGPVPRPDSAAPPSHREGRRRGSRSAAWRAAPVLRMVKAIGPLPPMARTGARRRARTRTPSAG